MDNITHTLFGATLARTPLRRAGRGTTLALILASNAPDIDIATTAGGAASYLKWHRGPTHGPLGIVVLGLVTAALVWGGGRMWGREREDGPDGRQRASFATLAAVSMLGVLLHILMDLPTSYGTRLLSPFDWHWYAVDLLPIVDIYLLAILAGGLFFGRTAYSRAPQRNAAIALALMMLNYGIRGAAHHQAMAATPRVFGPTLPERCVGALPEQSRIDRWPQPGEPQRLASEGSPRCLVEVAAMPSFVSPFEWRLVARVSNGYETRDVSLVDARLGASAEDAGAMWRLARHYPNVWTPATTQAAASPVAQVFLGFSRFPQARTVSDQQHVMTVRFEDMRFTAPGPRRGSDERPNIFTVIVRIGPDGKILEQKLGP
jgi:inner membrane protein